MPIINSPESAAKIVMSRINSKVEELWILCLGSRGQLLAKEMIFRGTVDACPSHPREIFHMVILNLSSSFIMIHNHPSGDPTPSKQDLILTARISKLAKLFEIPMLDHIILGNNCLTSLSREGFLKGQSIRRTRKAHLALHISAKKELGNQEII